MEKIKLKTLGLLVLILIVAFSCSSASNIVGGEEFEGWKNENGIDTYYVKTSARASENAIEKDDQEMMKNTCIEAAKLIALDNMIRKMIGETLEAQSGMIDAQATNFAITSIRSGVIKGVNTKECKATEAKWKNCVCIHYASGRNLKKQIEFEVQKTLEGKR
ncbi:MAG: hypothetical protein ACK4UJ_03515 [Leptonema sp. (in: bacteria)]